MILEKLRHWGIALSIIVAIPLLLFIVDPVQVEQTLQALSSKYHVGKIGSKTINYQEFQGAVEQMSRVTEAMTGRSASSEQEIAKVRNIVWQQFVDENLFIKNAQAAGIQVGKDEIRDLISGDNISPVIASAFSGPDGTFSQEIFTNFLQQVEMDETGRLSAVWDYIKNTAVTQQYYAKYNALFVNSSLQNKLQEVRTIADNNTTADVSFVMVPLGYATDSTVVVSDKEIQNYYNTHKKFFQQEAVRNVEYAVFQVVPSESDKLAASDDFTDAYDDFATTDNVRAFLQRNSDRQYSTRWYKEGELNTVNREVDAFVAAHTSGTSPVYSAGNTFYAVRVLAAAQIPDSVYVRHMLFYGADAKEQAESVLPQITGNNFSALAAAHSADQNSADGGELGNIGWLTQNVLQYLPNGFDAVFTAPVGKPFVIKSDNTYHIVEVVRATAPVLKKQVAIYEKETLPSKETYNNFYNQANRLATLSRGHLQDYQAACDSLGVYSHTMAVHESTDSYGSIGHAKEVTRWVFDNKPGKVSNIITVDNNYFFVVGVKDAAKEGIAPLSTVASQIKNQLYREKYALKRAADIKAEIEGLNDLESIAEKLQTSVSTQNDVAFASLSSRSLDPKFVGAIAAAEEGAITGPVAGNYGVYVFQVTGRETGAYYNEDDAKAYRQQLTGYTTQQILPAMMEAADVKDHRARFF